MSTSHTKFSPRYSWSMASLPGLTKYNLLSFFSFFFPPSVDLAIWITMFWQQNRSCLFSQQPCNQIFTCGLGGTHPLSLISNSCSVFLFTDYTKEVKSQKVWELPSTLRLNMIISVHLMRKPLTQNDTRRKWGSRKDNFRLYSTVSVPSANAC